VALLTDLISSRFQAFLEEANPEKNVIGIKHLLFDALLEPLGYEANQSNQFTYSTFRYGKEREKRWVEMEEMFTTFIG